MELIIKPTERCNFKCTFCSSTQITDDKSDILDPLLIEEFLRRFPDTSTIIVNGGDPLMMNPDYYWMIIDTLDRLDLSTTLSFTTNLWPFYQKPTKWADLFRHERVGVTTSFQYGGGRLKGDLSEFSERDFWNVSDTMLEWVGYRPDFISVITYENWDQAIKNVELAKRMDVECKLNYAVSSGPPMMFRGVRMGQEGDPFVLADIYETYVEIWKLGLAPWEYNTKQMVRRLQYGDTTCPQNRSCDSNIRALQPNGEYYSCGAFGDDRTHSIDFRKEMSSDTVALPLSNDPELLSMKRSCFGCPMFDICNGCRKTIKDMKVHGLVERHCSKMKQLAPAIIEANGMTGILEPTPYENEDV